MTSQIILISVELAMVLQFSQSNLCGVVVLGLSPFYLCNGSEGNDIKKEMIAKKACQDIYFIGFSRIDFIEHLFPSYIH